jgi:hypothetical protein
MAFDILDQVQSSLSVKSVGIEEFAESENYCGKHLYPRQLVLLKLIFLEEMTGEEEDVLSQWIKGGRGGTEIAISPAIRERRDYLRENGIPHFREIVLCGGRRSSKGFVTGIAMAKVMWDALQLQDPGQYYGIDTEKEIYFSCVASAEIQAKKFQYADLVSTVETCKAFEPYLAKSLETEFGVMTPGDMRKLEAAKNRNRKVQRHVAKLRGNALASNASTIRGSATMALCIDEMAHMLPGESRASADQVYDAATPSLDQFGEDAIIFCNSSPYTKVGKFYEQYVNAMAITAENKPTDPLSFTFQFPSWALYEGYQKSIKHKFKKAITVSADWDPDEKHEDGTYVWSKSDRNQILIARAEEAKNPEKYKVERRGKFAEVVDAYLDPQQVDRMGFGVPFFVPGDGLEFKPLKSNYGAGATYRFKYAAHLDPSSTTAGFGFALAHVEELPNTNGEVSDHLVYDIVKRWQPQSFVNGVIDWETIITEVFEYIKIFRPVQVTFDQFQSHAPIQSLQMQMQKESISGTRIFEKFATNESNWHRAEIFKTALYMGLLHAPFDTADTEWAFQELKFLQQINTAGRFPRVDKQDVGPVQTKDMADCMMVLAEHFLGNIIARDARDQLTAGPSPGAAGGFKIGGQESATPEEILGFYSRGRTGEQRTMPGRAGSGRPLRRGRLAPRQPRGW